MSGRGVWCSILLLKNSLFCVIEMSTSKPHPAHSLIIQEHVISALRNEKGEEAEFTSFEIKDFGSEGDGYIGYVTSVLVHFSVGDLQSTTSYVLKINPLQPDEVNSLGMAEMFKKETQFFDLLPKMNRILSKNQQTLLDIPRCYFYCLGRKKEIIYLEDMRNRNFKLYRDLSDGVDRNHTLVVFEELAKMHASSMLLAKEEGVECLTAKYESLKSVFGKEYFPNFFENFNEYFTGATSNAANIAKLVGGFYKVEKYFQKSSPDIMSILANWHKNCNSKFRVVCHGDMWINNVLFSYDVSGRPSNACLLDFQCITSASLAVDLNHFLYLCLTAKERNDNIDEFLSVYYNSFKRVMDSAEETMKFTLEELKKEYREYNLYGLLCAGIDLPVTLMKESNLFDFHNLTEEKLNEHHDKVLKAVKTQPQFKSRLLDSFDEVIRNGLL